MAKYGTLEVGMELADVAGYAEGSGLVDCRRHDVVTFVMPDAVQVSMFVDAASGLVSKYELIYVDPLAGVEVRQARVQRRELLRHGIDVVEVLDGPLAELLGAAHVHHERRDRVALVDGEQRPLEQRAVERQFHGLGEDGKRR